MEDLTRTDGKEDVLFFFSLLFLLTTQKYKHTLQEKWGENLLKVLLNPEIFSFSKRTILCLMVHQRLKVKPVMFLIRFFHSYHVVKKNLSNLSHKDAACPNVSINIKLEDRTPVAETELILKYLQLKMLSPNYKSLRNKKIWCFLIQTFKSVFFPHCTRPPEGDIEAMSLWGLLSPIY